MEEKTFDIAVIGGGPGGYVAAIKAAQTGKRVALIEGDYMGGVCLNWGCIPTKTLIASSSLLHKIRHAKRFGIETGSISFDYGSMKERKDKIITDIRKSLEGLIQSHKVHIIRGFAKFDSPNVLKVEGESGLLIRAEKIIIATGSTSREIPAFPFDHQKILSAKSMLEIETLPKSLAIIGGGVIGCEFASLYAEMGVEVTILEAMDRLISIEAPILSTALAKALKAQGVTVKTNAKVLGIDASGSTCHISLEGEKIEADLTLVAVGVSFNSSNIGLDKAGVLMDERGAIQTNEHMETNVPGIYAIGDVTGKAMLAHVASHAGIVAAINATGGNAKMHYNAIPSVIFTQPEIASVGLSLEKALAEGYDAVLGAFPFAALGKAKAAAETDGFAQVVIDKSSNQILGAQIVGAEASALIAEMVLAVQNELTADCLTETIHAHPTLSEAWMEAAFIAQGSPIHYPPQRR